MFEIDSFAFDKTLIFIVDSDGVFISLNSELDEALSACHISDCVGLTVNMLDSNLPHYMKKLLSYSGGSIPSQPIVFDNGSLSLFSHEFQINEINYTYFMAKFSKDHDNNLSIIDVESGLYNHKVLDLIPASNGWVLLIKLNGSVCIDGDNDRLIKKFSELLSGCFMSGDVICRVNDSEFLVFRVTNKNDFHKNILSLKRKTLSIFRDTCPDFWFSYTVERVFYGRIHSALLSAESKLVRRWKMNQ